MKAKPRMINRDRFATEPPVSELIFIEETITSHDDEFLRTILRVPCGKTRSK